VRDTTVREIGIVTVTGARTAAAPGGASTIAIRPDSLRLSPAPLLHEALRELPFVLVRQNSRGEMELSVRGSESRQAAVMLDGMPLTLGWDGRSDPSLIPLSGVQGITLVRGLSSLLHGPNILGGVVEIGVGAPARGSAPAANEQWLASGVDQYGAHSHSLGAGRPIQLANGATISLRAGGAYRERDGYAATDDGNAGGGATLSAGSLRTNSDLRQVDGFASGRWHGSGGRNLGVTVTAYSADRGVPPELHVTSPRLWRYPEQNRMLTVISGRSGLVRTPAGYAELDVSGGYTAGRVEIESYTDDNYTTVNGRESGAERTLSARIAMRHTLPADGELRVALTGGEVRYDETLDLAAANRYRQQIWSTGSEVEWPIARATVSGGVVYDASATPETGGKPALGTLGSLGWRAGISAPFHLNSVRLHGSVSNRSRFPALRELYSGSLDRFEPNPALRPESLLGMEVGATLTGGALARGGVMLQAVAFHHRLDDAIVRVAIPDSRKFQRINQAGIRSVGGELIAGWSSTAPPGRAFTLAGDLLVQRVRAVGAGTGTGAGGAGTAAGSRRVEHQPEVRGGVDAGFPLPLLARGFVGTQYTGSQYCVHPDSGTQVRLPGSSAASAGAERTWRVGGPSALLSRLKAVIALDNIANATIHDQCGLPQPGRTLRLGIQLL
jgi:iron complex outermembrane recepter protein